MAKPSYVPSPTKIKVVGIGGAGSNAITRMVREHIRAVEFIAMNTDVRHLEITEAPMRIALGKTLTGGLGAGGDNNLGRRCAEETRDEIKQALAGADMVFLAAGMGGGTGTGATPVVAEVSRQSGALTIAIVTKPFTFEGNRRMRVAEEGISQLVAKVDTLIVVSNDRLLKLCGQKTSVDGAFKFADEILCHAVQAIAETITVPGLINLDFASVRAIMKDSGLAWMSVGHGSGQNRAVHAAKEALASPLLDVTISGAKNALFRIVGGRDLNLFEVNDAAKVIQQAFDLEANIIFGVIVDPNMGDEVRLTLIATGFAYTPSVTTAVTSSANPSVFGQSVTFTATVGVTSSGAGSPTGAVDFKDGLTTIASGVSLSGNTATFTTASLSLGSHSITAVYSGDTNFNGSASSPLTQTVIGLKDLKTSAVAELLAAKTSVKEVGKNIDKAIEHIQKSLKAELWVNATHLDSKHDNKVFDEEKDAVKALQELTKDKKTPGAVATLGSKVIDKLLKADRLLAEVALKEAQAYAGASKKVDREVGIAVKELAKGNTDVAQGKYESAIVHYRDAWKYAQHTIGK